MLKLIDKIAYVHEGETIFYGNPFEAQGFISNILKTKPITDSNPICTISNLLNKNLHRGKKLKDSDQNRLLVTYESFSKFKMSHFIQKLAPHSELPKANKKFREHFIKRFFIVASRIIQFTVRDYYALLFYVIEIIVLGAFGCVLFYNLDGVYIETGTTPE
jgi:hypothetical protein